MVDFAGFRGALNTNVLSTRPETTVNHGLEKPEASGPRAQAKSAWGYTPRAPASFLRMPPDSRNTLT